MAQPTKSRDPPRSDFHFKTNFPKTCVNGDEAVQEFTFFFGDDETNLSNMQRLCRACGMKGEDVPSTTELCKEKLKTTWVNIHDVLEAVRTGSDPPVFSGPDQLYWYSRNTGKGISARIEVNNPLFEFMLKCALWGKEKRDGLARLAQN